MWTCIKCGQANEDQVTVCTACGASRSAGRFGSGQAPKNAAAYSAMPHQNAPSPASPHPAPQTQYVPDFSHVRAGKGFMVVGTLLALVLPVLVILFSILMHESWTDALDGFLHAARAEGETPSFWVSYLLYGFLAIVAALFAALPGLWTLGLGKMLRRLSRMEELL